MNSNHRIVNGTLYLRTDDPAGFEVDGERYLAAEYRQRTSNLNLWTIVLTNTDGSFCCDFLGGNERLWTRLQTQMQVDLLDLPATYRED